MPDADPPFTVHLSDPGEVAAALPHLLGYAPRESLVAVSLHGPGGRRFGLTARIDLPPAAHARPVLRGLARSMLTDRPAAVLLLMVSEQDDEHGGPGPGELPHRSLLGEAVLAFTAAEVPVRQVLLVRGGRWWSYDCGGACCLPGAGTPLPGGTSPLAVASVVSGQVVEADRAELARRVAPVGFLAAAGMARACDEVGDQLARRTAELGWDAVAEESWAAVLAAVAGAAPGVGAGLSDRDVARLAWALRDVDVRDRALTLALGRSADAAEAVWADLTRRAPGSLAAAPATLLAVTAWVRGNGSLANVALERALASEPTYTFAVLLRAALDACLPPAEVRRLIRDACGPSRARR
ncbi:conserved protein of unknown function [Modestobacter italicus]|uniref:DUF4192 domain-containing protein n=1 Tax=Modestobacter italicus (strain DSM 44449 / CECT 9708 / BC 501) TaxID=2732864 RepID=I4F146_MODI5|nr:DUF4192 domain-containing protein [Modestobacter marinus]CCH89359.1 conserved protein of unknown function [Modestobacter marinus]